MIVFRYCASWASLSECSKNPSYMSSHCPIACGLCQLCEDFNQYCETWARQGECKTNRKYMSIYCKKVSISGEDKDIFQTMIISVMWHLQFRLNSSNPSSSSTYPHHNQETCHHHPPTCHQVSRQKIQVQDMGLLWILQILKILPFYEEELQVFL